MWKSAVLRRVVAIAGNQRRAASVIWLVAVALSASARTDHSPASQSASPTPAPAETITFRNVRLADVLVELNRYQSKPIRIKDSRLADLTISGVLNLRDPDALLDVLKIYHNVQAKKLADGSVMLSKG